MVFFEGFAVLARSAGEGGKGEEEYTKTRYNRTSPGRDMLDLFTGKNKNIGGRTDSHQALVSETPETKFFPFYERVVAVKKDRGKGK